MHFPFGDPVEHAVVEMVPFSAVGISKFFHDFVFGSFAEFAVFAHFAFW